MTAQFSGLVQTLQSRVAGLNYLYVIKFASDLRQVGAFPWVLRFPPSVKLTATISLKFCWK